MSNFPKSGKKKKEILSIIDNIKKEDTSFSSGKIFGSMCTQSLELGKEIHSQFLESNLGNPGLYPGTKRLEKEVHEAVRSLINLEKGQSYSVGGGTEANILALWRARKRSGNKEVILPKSAHFSFKKACDLLDMRENYISLDNEYKMDLDDLQRKVNENTAMIVGIAGTTELGQIDPIKELAELSDDIHLHVDAAFGGFVIPFLEQLGYDLPEFDFSLDGLDSMTVDPHKMGLSTIPLGLFFERKEESFSIKSPYLTANEQKTLRGTRCSASIPAFWTVMNYLGFEGYKNVVSECMENTYYIYDKAVEIGLEPIIDPILNIVSFHHKNPKKIVMDMSEKGWNISRTVNPPGLRFVIMPHVTKNAINKMMKSLEEVI